MNIRLTSTLTAEDENTIAPIVLKAVSTILDLFPIAYSLQIDTSDARVYKLSRTQRDSPDVGPAADGPLPRS